MFTVGAVGEPTLAERELAGREMFLEFTLFVVCGFAIFIGRPDRTTSFEE